jgi:HK97 gp10 family phage protein
MHETVPVGQGVLEEALGYEVERWKSSDGESSLTIDVGVYKGYRWGSLQEFGTIYQPAQHWFGRAFEASKDDVLNEFSTNAVGLLLDLQNKKGS